ncbi:AMP-binding protein [Jatrophihabitans fulvus]
MTARDLTVYSALAQQAEKAPDSPLMRFGGQDHSRRQIFDTVTSVAAGLRGLGLNRGDRALLVADNSMEHVAAWLGADAAGLIDVPINNEARGAQLRYLVEDAAPRVLIGHPHRLHALAGALPAPPDHVVVIGPDCGDTFFGDGAQHLTLDDLIEFGRDGDVVPPGNSDSATMIYTSGTTGPSKGVLVPQASYVRWAERGLAQLGMTEGETVFTPEPLFHSDARAYVIAALISGGRVAVGDRFSVSGFWDAVREADAKYFAYLGTMLSMLFAAAPRDDDDDNPAVVGTGAAAPAAIHEAFERRFGVRLLEMYGMTESMLITANSLTDSRIGSVGKPVPELEVALVDEDDEPVAVGEVGEVVLRPHHPDLIMNGYWGKPDATVAAWRNLWFHTGDRMRADDDGFFYYVGRLKDSIRRRGENVSAWEVEIATGRHPDVLTSAAIGVPSDLGEEDVAVLAVPRGGHVIDPAGLHAFLAAELPRYAVPRFIEIVDALPRTPTERVDKNAVRTRGLTDLAWDATPDGRHAAPDRSPT